MVIAHDYYVCSTWSCIHCIIQSDLYFWVDVIDEDSGDDDIVDTFIIPFDCTQRADSTFSDPTVYIGACGSARIKISISITSLCPDDTYGPQCNVFCDEQPGNYTCNYLGEKICVPGYEDPANECKTPSGMLKQFQLEQCSLTV